MGKKLGLTNVSKEDVSLITPLLEMMRVSQLDYTNLFRSLGLFKFAPDEKNSELRDQFIDRPAFDAWAEVYRYTPAKRAGNGRGAKNTHGQGQPKIYSAQFHGAKCHCHG